MYINFPWIFINIVQTSKKYCAYWANSKNYQITFWICVDAYISQRFLIDSYCFILSLSNCFYKSTTWKKLLPWRNWNIKMYCCHVIIDYLVHFHQIYFVIWWQVTITQFIWIFNYYRKKNLLINGICICLWHIYIYI